MTVTFKVTVIWVACRANAGATQVQGGGEDAGRDRTSMSARSSLWMGRLIVLSMSCMG